MFLRENKSNRVRTIDAFSLVLVPLYHTFTCSFVRVTTKMSLWQCPTQPCPVTSMSPTEMSPNKNVSFMSLFVICHSSFVICHSSFVIHISGSEKLILSFVIRRLSFVIRHSKSLILYHFITLSFVVCHSSFVIRRLSFTF